MPIDNTLPSGVALMEVIGVLELLEFVSIGVVRHVHNQDM